MALTAQEEQVLKLIATETIARMKLNNVNQAMGDAIRTEFNVIDQRIRNENKAKYEPLQQEVAAAKKALLDAYKE